MRLKLASALLALSSLAVSACGFTPVYGNLDGAETSSIQVNAIPGSTGHALRQELILLLRAGIPGIETGTLTIDLTEKNSPFVIGADASNVRTIVKTDADYTLESNIGKFSGDVQAETSFYANERTMAEVLAQRQASTQAAKETARKIVSALISQVARKNAKDDKSVQN